jgi:hypothetical protein
MSEFSLSIRPDLSKSESELVITDHLLRWGKESLLQQDIVGLKYGYRKSTPQVGTVFFFLFRDRFGKDLNIGFSSRSDTAGRAKGIYDTLEAQMLAFYGEKVILGYHAKIKAGGEVRFGVCILTKKGMAIEEKNFFRTHRQLITWDHLGFGANNTEGFINIGDRTNPKIVVPFNLFGEFNGHYLIKYIDRVQNTAAWRAELE